MIEQGCKAMDSEPRTGKPRHQVSRSLNMSRQHSTSDTRTDDVTGRERSRWLMGSQISSWYLGDGNADLLGKGLTR